MGHGLFPIDRMQRALAEFSDTLRRVHRPLGILSLLLFSLLAAVGLHRMKREVERFPDLRVHPRAFKPVHVPGWADPALVASLRETSAGMPTFSLLDPDLRSALDRHYRRNPWVREVTRVEKEFPNRLKVTARLRRPIALVEVGSARKGAEAERLYYPVDSACVRLSGTMAVTLDPAGTPAVQRVGDVPIPVVRSGFVSAPRAAGRVWDDEGVRNGVAVALELYDLYNSPLHDRLHVAAIDVSNAGGRVDRRTSEIVLLTDSGKQILWGRSTRSRAFGEIPTSQKIANLGRILETYPGLLGVSCAKVLFEQPYVVLESETASVSSAPGGHEVGLTVSGAAASR